MNVNDLGLEPTEDEEVLRNRIRFYRTMLLTASDWAMSVDAPTDKAAWQDYRQQLRDFPSVWTIDENPDFPLSPIEATLEASSSAANSAE
jgi:hypothetical protein